MTIGLSTTDAKKLGLLSKDVYANAKEHGWHEQYQSPQHWLCLIMTEVSEAINADRKGKRAQLDKFMNGAKTIMPKKGHEEAWILAFSENIKDTVEDELADVVIRLLDMSQAIYGNDMEWLATPSKFSEKKSFTETAWKLTSKHLNWDQYSIRESIAYVNDWAESLGISLQLHIKLKMAYNQFRPYKHGNKKY